MTPLIGIFVGGRATRMGGVPKGLLIAPDGAPLAARLAQIAAARGRVMLVGAAEAYRELGLPALADAPGVPGPLGGLLALLQHAGEAPAIALACDLPFVTQALFDRLLATAPEAAAVAPRDGDRWQPLFARYDAPRALAAGLRVAERGQRALHRVIDELGDAVQELALDDAERAMLRDWDRPEDITGG